MATLTQTPTFTPDSRSLQGSLLIRRIGKAILWITPVFSYLFLWAPILLLILFSFNAGRGTFAWRGFTTQWYSNIFSGTLGAEARFSTELMLNALSNSLIVGVTSTLIATVIGTMVAISMTRGKFPGKRILDGLLFLPVVIPEITQGVSLAIFFRVIFEFIESITGARILPGVGTIIIGHVVFNVAFVAIIVRARMSNMNPRLEEAAGDLGATPWQTFYRVTLPLIMPGVIAGALLAFTLSLDDFVVTFFNKGVGSDTLPIFVYGMLKTSVTPEVNALSTLMLIFSTVLVGFSLFLQNRKD
ncbi:MAG: ABC transporter permease [Anaerolineae bacterium]|jgi:spermidine/putrescine transport system permease protein|nr:ABC transporter permease [Anaerolineae bacterium]